MDKKAYQKPEIKKVHLDVKSAILGTCRVSAGAPDRDGNTYCLIAGILDPCMFP